MSYTFTISAAALKAVALAKGVHDIRYYLNGVLIEAHEQGTFLVATDGHRMHAMRVLVTYADDSAKLPVGTQIILPDSAIGTLKLTKTEGDTLTVVVDDNWRSGQLNYGLTYRASWQAVGGKFPDWRRVLPRGATVDGKGCTINPDYLMDIKKAAKLLGAKDLLAAVPQLQFGGTVRALLDVAPEFVGVIMEFQHRVKGGGGHRVLPCPDWAE